MNPSNFISNSDEIDPDCTMIKNIWNNMKLKLHPRPIPPNGNKPVNSIEELDVYTVIIKDHEDLVESDIIGYINKSVRVRLHRPFYQISETESLTNILLYSTPISWHEPFMASLSSIERLDNKITRDKDDIVPLRKDIFNCFHCEPQNVKVVIIGQDPYYTVHNDIPVAMGYAFSTRRGIDVPRSLQNIYNEINNDYPDFIIPHHGDLTNWVKQGVLLLNSALTTIRGYAKAHSGLWNEFLFNVITYLMSRNRDVIFLLWGNDAKQLIKSILGSSKFAYLEASHPSPLSYAKFRNPFKECGHFKKANEYLMSVNKTPIDWNAINK